MNTSIIHGAKRVCIDIGTSTKWVDQLALHLQSTNLDKVTPFFWTGRLHDAFSEETTEAYLEHLLELSGGGTKPINIFAKSLGAIIAEVSLDKIYKSGKTLQVNNFVRVGVPDTRSTIGVGNVFNIVNIISHSDSMYRYAKFPLSLLIKHFVSENSVQKLEPLQVLFEGFSHSDFNEHGCVVSDKNGTRINIYDYYSNLLK